MTRIPDCTEFYTRLIEMYGSLTEARICLLEACTEVVFLGSDSEDTKALANTVGTFRFMADCIGLLEEKEVES